MRIGVRFASLSRAAQLFDDGLADAIEIDPHPHENLRADPVSLTSSPNRMCSVPM
jgi:hypothetical protein